MMNSLWEDFKYNIAKGTRLNQVLLINVSVFIVILFARIILNIADGGNPEAFNLLTKWLSLNTDLSFLIGHPWILITHMFTHIGLWHLLWNMLMLYWFGNIVGDLLGDQYIWRTYLTGGLSGAFLIIFFSRIFHYPSDIVMAYGASAAVMGFILAATVIAPDYLMHLLIIGSVKLKYVALVVIVIDLVGIAEQSNTGGHLGHMGGALGGILMIWWIRQGIELFPGKNTNTEVRGKIIPIKKSIKALSETRGNTNDTSQEVQKLNPGQQNQEEIDRILDKISAKGINSLTEEERGILDKSSK
ncbi:MAG: rhomboid family intramembrane serine protease [Saprospiraceae bacterium]